MHHPLEVVTVDAIESQRHQCRPDGTNGLFGKGEWFGMLRMNAKGLPVQVHNRYTLLGAETGDLAAFEFDLQTRAVRVRVGGPGLFEQIEDPGTISEDVEPPDDELELET
jgi:hypothetical protein